MQDVPFWPLLILFGEGYAFKSIPFFISASSFYAYSNAFVISMNSSMISTKTRWIILECKTPSCLALIFSLSFSIRYVRDDFTAQVIGLYNRLNGYDWLVG